MEDESDWLVAVKKEEDQSWPLPSVAAMANEKTPSTEIFQQKEAELHRF